MKKLIAILTMVALAGCAGLTGPNATTQTAQTAYVQACTAYGAAFAGALQAREAGKLNAAQIQAVTNIDSQITPICTGPLPADPTAATSQITAAITTLTLTAVIQSQEKK